MMDVMRWKRNRNELGFIEHTLYDSITYNNVGYVKPVGKKFEAYVEGRPTFTRETLKSAKKDVEYMYDKLGVGVKYEKA